MRLVVRKDGQWVVPKAASMDVTSELLMVFSSAVLKDGWKVACWVVYWAGLMVASMAVIRVVKRDAYWVGRKAALMDAR